MGERHGAVRICHQSYNIAARRHEVGLGDAICRCAVGRERRHPIIGNAIRSLVVCCADGDDTRIVGRRVERALALVSSRYHDDDPVEPQNLDRRIQRFV
jgi:hypothetical protein